MFTSTRDRRRGLALLVALLLVTTRSWADPPPSPPPPVTLTLEGALSTARQNSRLLAAAHLRIGEARGDLTGASILLVNNPEIVAQAGPRLPGAADGDTTLDLSVGVEQFFETGGQRGDRIARAQAEVDASRASAADVQRVIELAVARAFYGARAADLRLQLLEENERLVRELHEVARRRLEAGEATPLELNAARIRLAEAQRRTVVARTARQVAAVRLAELLGLAPSTQLTLQGDLPGDEAAPAADVLVASALRARPDLAAAARGIDASAAAIDLADAEAWPDIGVGVFYSRDEGDDIFTAGLRVPLPLFNRNQGERQRARATRDRLVAERGALVLSVESEVRQALLAYEQARSALQLYDAEVLRAQEESLGLLERAFEAGEVGISDVIVLQRELIEGREGFLDVRLDLALTRAGLLAAASLPQTGPLQGGTP